MTLNDFLDKAKAVEGYVTIAMTDKYMVDFWPSSDISLTDCDGKILEIRVFNDNLEMKLFRSCIGNDYSYCLLDDNSNKREYFDQSQILDIDTARSESIFKNSGMVYTTGGGYYKLPTASMDNPKIVVRHYITQNANGQAEIDGWRLVGFKEE